MISHKVTGQRYWKQRLLTSLGFELLKCQIVTLTILVLRLLSKMLCLIQTCESEEGLNVHQSLTRYAKVT